MKVNNNKISEILYNKTIGIVSNGFVGSRLYKYIQQNYPKNRIIVLDRVNIKTVLTTTVFDYLFNCAGNTGDFRQKPFETIDSNLLLTRQLLEYAQIKEALIYLSSTRIYGFTTEKNLVFDENYIATENHLSSDFIYNGTKKLTETFLMNVQKDYKVIICRLSNLIGDYKTSDLDDSTYLKVLLRHKIENKSIIVKQNIYSSKDYILIEDALRGIVQSAIYSKESNYFNIASGRSYSLEEVLTYLEINYSTETTITQTLYSSISVQKAKTQISFQANSLVPFLQKNLLFSN